MRSKTRKLICFLLAYSTGWLTGLSNVYAQQNQIEEVVVSAENENQTVNDLVSTSSLDAEKLADAGIENVEDVAAYVPNLVLTETETGTNIVVRGIGAGINQGFDQSVGLYADRVPLPRANMARAPFLDLSSVQVLRGPQYVLDGNFSIAGSVHMLTNLKTEELDAGFDFNYIPDQNDNKLLFTIGGPINDDLAMRVAIQRKKSDGYIQNVTLGEPSTQREELISRLVFGWKVNENIYTKFKVEKGSFDTRGRAIELIFDEATPDVRGISQGLAPDIAYRVPRLLTENYSAAFLTEADFDLAPLATLYDVGDVTVLGSDENRSLNGYYFSGRSYLETIAALYSENGFQAPVGFGDAGLDYQRAVDGQEFSNNDSLNYTLNTDFDFGNHVLESTTSYIEYDFDEKIDADFTAAPLLESSQAESYSQIFQRFDYRFDGSGGLQIQAGISFLSSDLDFTDNVIPIIEELPPVPPAQIDPSFSPNDPLRAHFARFFAGRSLVAIADRFVVDRFFEQESKIFSAFFNSEIRFSPSVRGNFGLRFTSANKKAVRDTAFIDDEGNVPTSAEEPNELDALFSQYASVFGVQSHTDRYSPSLDIRGIAVPAARGRRSEQKLLPSLSFEWDISPDFTLIASARQANKLGGFDARANATPNVIAGQGVPSGTFEFEDESATTFELGARWFLPNSLGEFYATAFYTEFEDLQVSRNDGRAGTQVDNAATATTLGIEIEGQLTPTRNFSIPISLAWIDFQFDDYKEGACYLGNRPDFRRVSSDISILPSVTPEQAAAFPVGSLIRIEYIGRPPSPTDPDGVLGAGSNPPNLAAFDDNTIGGIGVCDFSGKTNQFVAEWEGRISLEYKAELKNYTVFKPTIDFLYNSGYHTIATQDPDVEQDAFLLINSRIAIASRDEIWEVAVTGQNLTDEKVISYANGTPISAIQGSRNYLGFVRPPRSIGINLRYKFY